jgi:diadenosine tetraphosphate (Ap4A) HIT family hydrolase
LALPDAYPVSEGHSLVVPRAHFERLFDAPAEVQAAVWDLVESVRRELTARLRPDGYNVGINEGACAGQTIWHAHVHVIPRFDGDVQDPRGGIRWVIPERARYWDE